MEAQVQNRSETPAIVIFIKNAKLGNAKTRLAATVGAAEALKIYNSLLQFTRNIALSIDVDRYVYYSDIIIEDDAWNRSHFKKKQQRGVDLGERMMNAFREVLAEHQQAIIIGSDCATLTPELILSAFDNLTSNDVVMGPSRDGGYYLLGMKELFPDLFLDIPWSTDQVQEVTLSIIHASAKKVALLSEGVDIDYESDWLEYGWPI